MAALIREWLDTLAPRERHLVTGGAVVVVLALVWALGIQPLLSAHRRAEADVESRQALLTDLEQALRRFGPLGPAPSSAVPGGRQSLVVLVDRMTRERGLGAYLKRNQPDGATGVRLRLEDAPFDALVEWLLEAQTRHGLVVTSVSFDPSGQPGRVNTNLVLSQG